MKGGRGIVVLALSCVVMVGAALMSAACGMRRNARAARWQSKHHARRESQRHRRPVGFGTEWRNAVESSKMSINGFLIRRRGGGRSTRLFYNSGIVIENPRPPRRQRIEARRNQSAPFLRMYQQTFAGGVPMKASPSEMQSTRAYGRRRARPSCHGGSL